MPFARSLPLVVLVALLALIAVPLAAAPAEDQPADDQPAATAPETAAAPETPAPPSPEPPAALPWELPAPQQKCETSCNEGTCTICYDCTGRCLGISCPWGDFQC